MNRPSITESRLLELMELAVREATLSRSEDARVHPRVGAVLASCTGEVQLTAHRGEERGAHAEYLLLQRARSAGVDTENSVLFTTLEPCIHRGPGKIPCAERIAAARLAKVFIGTLDPNPAITGRGEMYVSYTTTVDRFPARLIQELRQLNAAFFEHHRDAHVPAVSIYAAQDPRHGTTFPKPSLSRDRNVLQQSLDLISGSPGAVWVLAGDLSWYREAQITFLGAALDRRPIRILGHASRRSSHAAFRQAIEAARAIGAQVIEMEQPTRLKGALVSPATGEASMVLIDSGHASLLRCPDDQGLLELVTRYIEQLADAAPPSVPPPVDVLPVSDERLSWALRGAVAAYADASIRRARIDVNDTVPLTGYLERFKLFRVNRLAAVRARHKLPATATIPGSRWPITPPVVELLTDGRKVVIDGAHSIYMSMQRGDALVDVLLVEGATQDLPAVPLGDWNSVRVYSTKLPRERRYEGYAPTCFRPIRSAFEGLTATTDDSAGSQLVS